MKKRLSDTQKLRFLLHRHYGSYESYIRRVVPKYEEIQKAIVQAIPFKKNDKILVMELGLGTGETSNRILNNFKNVKVEAIEYSEKMKELATQRLSKYKSRFNIFLGDFTKVWPNKKYDIIISTLAIHHVKEKDKIPLLKIIFNFLLDIFHPIFFNKFSC